MRLLGRHCSSTELLLFVVCYLLGNFAIIKMQQKWNEQETDTAKAQARATLARTIHSQSIASQGQYGKVGYLYNRTRKQYLQPSVRSQMALENSNRHEDDQLEINMHMVTDSEFGPYPREDDLSNYPEKHEKDEMRQIKLGNPKEAGYKLILFWNTFFHSDDFRFGIGHQPFIEHKCPVHQCITTMDKRKLAEADVVMFHGPRVDNFPPPMRPPHQIYVYVQQEPHYAMSLDEIGKYNGYMNLTITHRQDSDIWLPYARVEYEPEKAIAKPERVSVKSKKRSVVWVVSHCATPGKREWYVQELQKYIDIDIYGDCGDMECSKDDTWYCYEKFAKEYLFFMALENNHCKDYVSEKVFRPMAYNIVPIVFGGGNYSVLTPPHSVIDITDYPHPKDLARHLHFLSSNEKAYNRYFSWKHRGYSLDTSRKGIMGEGFCKLCEIIHDPDFRYKEYRNLKSWWTHDICDTYVIPRMRRKAKW